MDNLDNMPARVKYFLLDWKDQNLETFQRKYGRVSLRSLEPAQLKALFVYAANMDIDSMPNK